ncbi:hypothetical protein SSX86_013717 [Deinandra increscens subsp. villosa]|uniref:Uncharacterized protein n=1 Tax=Deinandra increscens subsp. villosa TaxID=3103831 RepID=A0AAP0D571_9ASTR
MASSSSSGSSKRTRAELANNAVTCMVDECVADLNDGRKYYWRHKLGSVHYFSGTCRLESGGQQVQVEPTMNPPWSGFIDAPAWLDHSNYAPSFMSSLVHPRSDSGSVSVAAGPLENGCDVGWGGMDPHDHLASFDCEDPQTLPICWQSW